MAQYIWLVPLFPLLGFLIAGLGRNTLGKSLLGWIPTLAVLASFAVSLLLFFEIKADATPIYSWSFPFINATNLNIDFGFMVDRLNSIFLLVITGIGFLIHMYSISYMHDDEGFGKYFSYLNLFVFSMLLLVLGKNLIITFIGWEGVGLCSYLLIGFWYKKQAYTQAAKKAFVMNRIGDLGFLIGIFLLLKYFGTVDYTAISVKALAGEFAVNQGIIIAITACLFIGACGKSAQIPLFTWLPDAMAGPTPVSALIHAATMVTAGIFMITKLNILFTMAPATQDIILMIGLATALVAATIATKQNDIKKVLAYSTVSQLGFMFIALGTGAYVAAVFHVITHAFFKALLFLGSGSVIHGMGGEQDIRKMGGLKKAMPTTFITFLIGCIAIAGIPPLSGFFSKDEILMHLFNHGAYGKILWALASFAALLTAFYMFRLLYLTFFGKFRGTHEQEHHLHESPALMTIPLVLLAILSFVGGFIGVPAVFHLRDHNLEKWLAPMLEKGAHLVGHHEHLSHSTELMLMAIAVTIGIAGIFIAYNTSRKINVEAQNSGLGKFLEDKWEFDEAYNHAIEQPIMKTSNALNTTVEPKFIDGIVNGVGKIIQSGSAKLRLLQNGMVGFYLFLMIVGAIALFAALFTKI